MAVDTMRVRLHLRLIRRQPSSTVSLRSSTSPRSPPGPSRPRSSSTSSSSLAIVRSFSANSAAVVSPVCSELYLVLHRKFRRLRLLSIGRFGRGGSYDARIDVNSSPSHQRHPRDEPPGQPPRQPSLELRMVLKMAAVVVVAHKPAPAPHQRRPTPRHLQIAHLAPAGVVHPHAAEPARRAARPASRSTRPPPSTRSACLGANAQLRRFCADLGRLLVASRPAEGYDEGPGAPKSRRVAKMALSCAVWGVSGWFPGGWFCD